MKAYRLPAFLLLENFSSWLVFISILTYAGYEVALATHQQTLAAATGLGATFIGAKAMELSSPAMTMAMGSAIAVVVGFVWMLGIGKRPNILGGPSTEPCASPVANKPGSI